VPTNAPSGSVDFFICSQVLNEDHVELVKQQKRRPQRVHKRVAAHPRHPRSAHHPLEEAKHDRVCVCWRAVDPHKRYRQVHKHDAHEDDRSDVLQEVDVVALRHLQAKSNAFSHDAANNSVHTFSHIQ
jgi:hypothetical protein